MDTAGLVTTLFGSLFSILMAISLLLLNRIYRAIDNLLNRVGENATRIVRLEVASEHQADINKSFLTDFKDISKAVSVLSEEIRMLRENCIKFRHLSPLEGKRRKK